MLGFNHAFRGLIRMLKTERNFKIQITAFVFVVSLGLFLNISSYDWVALLLVAGLVLSLEIINSAIEKICDLYTIEKNEQIKYIKDISAGAVLIAALFAALVGGIVFYPYLLNQ